MSRSTQALVALVLAAATLGGACTSEGDDDPPAEGAASATTPSSATDESPQSAHGDFCTKFSTLASAQSAAASRMTAIFRDLTDDAATPDPALIATDLQKFVDRIEAAAALQGEAPDEIAADYDVVEAGLVGATGPYKELVAAARQSLAAARAYANDEFMGDIGELLTDAYIESGERVQDWVDANCPRQ